MFPKSCLVIFAKAPEPGKVKTRLLPTISAGQAAELQTRLIFNTLDLAHRQPLCRVQLWCSPSPDHSVFRSALNRYPIRLHTQVGSNLGFRMRHALSTNLESSGSVILIGCDCPSLTFQDLVDSFSALELEHDLVLGPAEDGGYVMIGMNRPVPELFCDIEWGTDQVLSETRSRIRQRRLRCFETREQWDIDRPDDLKRFLVSEGRGAALFGLDYSE